MYLTLWWNPGDLDESEGLPGLARPRWAARKEENVMTLNETFSGEGTGPNSGKLVNECWQNKEGGARVYFPPPLVFLISIALGVVLQRAVRPLTIPVGRTLSITGGIVLIAVAVCLFVSALVLFRRTGQHPPPMEANT